MLVGAAADGKKVRALRLCRAGRTVHVLYGLVDAVSAATSQVKSLKKEYSRYKHCTCGSNISSIGKVNTHAYLCVVMLLTVYVEVWQCYRCNTYA